MSIRGIGVDIAATGRVLRLFERYGQRFLAKAFHPAEVRALDALPAGSVGPFLASRWAAKEALHKALGTKRLLFPDIEVARSGAHIGGGGGGGGSSSSGSSSSGGSSSTGGPPRLLLHGAAGDYLRSQGLALHLTLSHEAGMAVAFVVATELGAAGKQ